MALFLLGIGTGSRMPIVGVLGASMSMVEHFGVTGPWFSVVMLCVHIASVLAEMTP